jgi:hypothetical protein
VPVTYPSPAIRRLFGITDDVIGGTSYENLTDGTVPDATVFWPVTGGSLDRGLTRIDKSNEVRGRRSIATPDPLMAGPTMTIPVPAYRSVWEKLMRKLLGATDTVTGSADTGYTHSFTELGFGATQLPSMHCQLVRDDLNQKMSGGFVNSLTASFPLDSEGTLSAEIQGLYYGPYATDMPTPTYTDVDQILLLRDASAYIDGSSTTIPDLQGVDLTFNNNITRKWYAGHNIVAQTLGASPLTRKLWFPSQYKLGAQLDITGTLTFGNVNSAQDVALDFAQVQKFAFNFVGGAISGSTGPQYEAVQVTINAVELTADSAGPGDLQANGDITYAVNFGGYYSPYDDADVQFQSINGISTALI